MTSRRCVVKGGEDICRGHQWLMIWRQWQRPYLTYTKISRHVSVRWTK